MKKVEEALIQEDFKAGDVIFNYGKQYNNPLTLDFVDVIGDQGDKFYIVLEGQVSMEMPDRGYIDNFDYRYSQYLLLLQ